MFFFSFFCVSLSVEVFLLVFRASRECVPIFVKMHGKEVHCTFFRANLRANVCAELGYEFYNDIYSEYVDVVSFKTSVKVAWCGWCVGQSWWSVCSQCSVLHINWSEVRYLWCFIAIFH